MNTAARIALAVLLIVGCAEPVGSSNAGSDDAGSTDNTGDAASANEDAPVANTPSARVAAAVVAVDPVGTWYLNEDGTRLTVTITQDENGAYQGTLSAEADAGSSHSLDAVTWDATARRLRFRYDTDGIRVWYQADVVEGTLMGRFATSEVVDTEPVPTLYLGHLTGWNSAVIDRDIVPRVFDVTWTDGRRGRLQIDRAAAGSSDFVGTLKVYATVANAALDEEEQHDLSHVSWDGAAFAADVDANGATWHYTGTARGRRLDGVANADSTFTTAVWSGTRVEVLSHGMTARAPDVQNAWRARTRAQMQHLMMGDNPQPIATTVSVVAAGTAPIAIRTVPGERDDDLSKPQSYTLTELQLDNTIADPRGGPAIVRHSHAYMAIPTTPPPVGGYPIALSLNGHWGSAFQVMDPSSAYWYGDGYARQGYLVIAVDISHRPVAERAALYTDLPYGDDPANGNGPHPAIASVGFDTDWAEDGERAWDAARVLDYALARPDVNAGRVLVTGLSLGGEVTTLVGALDPRVTTVVAAGFSPDLNEMANRAPHFCWQWQHADVREYVEVSDYHALIAPRRLVVETGISDPTYSNFSAPYASDKQVLRRSRAAYGGAVDRLVHYLHPGGHSYRVGDPGADLTEPRGVSVPALIAPDASNLLTWQTDSAIVQRRITVFDLMMWFRPR